MKLVMDHEKLKIAVAEECGWYRLDELNWAPKGWVKGRDVYGKLETTATLPDYPNDLNAMHAAVKTLTEDQYGRYFDILQKMFVGDMEAVEATAWQRATAFLKAVQREA